MPELKETIARLRELLEECKRREPYNRAESVRLHEVFAVFNATALETMPQLLDAAEECEKLRADKERLEFAMAHLTIIDVLSIDTFRRVGTVRIYNTRGTIDQAMQAHGQVSESTPEAKQEASPARKEKADA